MKHLLMLSVLSLFAACQCGPGKACKGPDDCIGIGFCGTNGYCLDNSIGPEGGGTGGSTTGGGGGATGGGESTGGGGSSSTDGGVPAIELTVQSIDFDLVDCGDVVSRPFGIKNVGGSALHYAVRIEGAGFALGAAAGALDSGLSASFNVDAKIERTMAAGQVRSGVIVIESDDAAQPVLRVPLTATAHGFTLVVEPPELSFGIVDGGTQSRDVTIRNVGNAAVQFANLPTASMPFAINFGSTTTLEPADQLSVGVTFSPPTAGAFNGAVSLTTTGATCGSSTSDIRFNGERSSSGVLLSSNDLFFGDNGRVLCGVTPPARTLTLTNASSAPWTFSASVGNSAAFTVSPTDGPVAAGASVTLSIASSGIPPVADTALEGFSDLLTITTDAPGDSNHTVTLHQSAHGAVLRAQPASVDFGQTPFGSTVSAAAAVVNTGSAPIAVELSGDGGPFSLSTRAVTASPGLNGFFVAYSPVDDAGVDTSTFALSVSDAGVLCSPLPAPFAVRGIGFNRAWSASPISLDFGEVPCGEVATPQTVRVFNAGTSELNITASLQRAPSSPFVVSPLSAMVGPGRWAVFKLAPNLIGSTSSVAADAYGDTLVLSSDEPTPKTQRIALHQTAKGSIFTFSRSSIDFGDVQYGATATSQFVVRNIGNAEGTIALDGVSTPFSVPTRVMVPGASNAQLTAAYTASSSDPTPQQMLQPTISGDTVLCGPLPASITLSGTAKATRGLSLSTTSISFGTQGRVNCGAQAPQRTVTLTNISGSASNMTVSFELERQSLDGGSPYTLSGATTGTMVTGTSRTVTVVPKRIPGVAADLGTGAYDDTLIIHASIPAILAEDYEVSLNESAQGAVLTFDKTLINPSALIFGAVGSPDSFKVKNLGNVAVPAFQLSVSTGYTFGARPSSVSPMDDSSEGQLYCGGVGTASGTLTVVDAGTTALCAPLPTVPTKCN